MIPLLLNEAHGWWGGGIVFVILLLILVLILVKVWFFRAGWWGRPGGWPDSSPEAVLKRRLARGEISEADYQHLRNVLRE